MGGDGGTKAVNRSYLRGAGSATTTADASRNKGNKDPAVAEHEAARAMRYCALTDQLLDFKEGAGGAIVTCPYGRLYKKEAAVEALIRRKQQSDNKEELLGSHIRGLKDLYEVRFQLSDDKTPVCPVTGRELNGKIIAYALVPGTKETVNVVSEYALKQLGEDAVMNEYGLEAKEKIRLAPPPEVLADIKKALEEKREKQSRDKASKKRHKKEKRKRASESSTEKRARVEEGGQDG